MADITKRRTGELVQNLFRVLQTQSEGMRASDALAALEKNIQLTAYEAGEYDSGGRRFERIVRFATIAPVKAGWLIKDKGIWTLTPEGDAALKAYPDPENFVRAAGKLYRSWKNAQPVAGDEEDVEESSATITLEQAEENAWNEIEAFLAEMPPYELQDLLASLLKAMGYHVA